MHMSLRFEVEGRRRGQKSQVKRKDEAINADDGNGNDLPLLAFLERGDEVMLLLGTRGELLQDATAAMIAMTS